MTNNTFNPFDSFDKEAFEKHMAEQQELMKQQQELFNKQMAEQQELMKRNFRNFEERMAEQQARFNSYKRFNDEAMKEQMAKQQAGMAKQQEQMAKQQEEMRKAQEEYAKNHPKEVEANRISWSRVVGFMPVDFSDLGDDGKFTKRDIEGEHFLLHILLNEYEYGLLMQNSVWMRTRHILAHPLNTYYTKPVKNDHTAQRYRKLTEFNISGHREDLEELLRKIYMVII